MGPYFRDVEKGSPEFVAEQMKEGVALDPLDRGISALRTHYADALNLLMASSGLLLLIACANIGGLLLARAALREREIAVRLAVGATRARIGRQILGENSILAFLGAAGGISIAFAATPRLGRWLPPLRDVRTKLLPLSLDLTVDVRVLLFAVFISVGALFLFSIGPAMAASRFSLDHVLRGTRSSSSWRGRQTLITIQIALCTFLLAIAGLFVRTFERLRAVDTGYDRNHIATFMLDLMGSGVTPKQESALRGQLLRGVRRLPGVHAAAVSSVGVMRGHGQFTYVALDDQSVNPANAPIAWVNHISPGYFEAMGMGLLEGRNLTEADTPPLGPAKQLNVVVNETFAHRFFAGIDPIGKRFGIRRIVGVVTDSRYRSLREPVAPTFYAIGSSYGVFMLNVRTRMEPRLIFRPVERVLTSIDPSLAFLEETTLSDQVHESMAAERLEASLASFFGALAALLAGVGIFGLLAQTVSQRYREIGIRMSLGARPVHIRRLIGGQVVALATTGVAIGLAGSLLAGRWMKSLVYGVSAADPTSLALSAIFVGAIALLAALIPARRAALIDPAQSLRTDG
jgi:predicted permease